MADVKQAFISRFEDGLIVEADFSSVEYYMAAILSGDPTLIYELQNGLDPHLENAAIAFNTTTDQVTKEQRSQAKVLTFQILYGAYYKTMAKTFNLSEAFTEKFVNNYYEKYSGISTWHEQLKHECQANRRPSKHKTDLGYAAGTGHITSFSGRRYQFIEYDTSEYQRKRKGILTRFNGSQIVNYPVQGGAFDIMSLSLGKLFRVSMKQREKYLLINTVHDSFLFDCKAEYLEELIKDIRTVENNLTNDLCTCYNLKSELKFKLDIECGRSWGEKEDYRQYIN